VPICALPRQRRARESLAPPSSTSATTSSDITLMTPSGARGPWPPFVPEVARQDRTGDVGREGREVGPRKAEEELRSVVLVSLCRQERKPGLGVALSGQ
jgi:hypothetical protein